MLCKQTRRADGVKGVQGAPDLKQSQEYPAAFGEALIDLYCVHRIEVQQDAAELKRAVEAAVLPGDLWVHMPDEDAWEDAGTTELLQYLLA